ncbi:MAG: ATP-binding protein [Geothrix sp.]|nr:ATP-binding protein [Geothrix sp.]
MHPRRLSPQLLDRASHYPVVTLTGPRQSGKTTLCRALFPELPYRSLESLDHRRFAQEDPRGFLEEIPEGAILDEIQRVPDLVSYLQEEVDRDPRPGRFILTGSENLSVSATVSQSLAGRSALLTLLPLSLDERQAFPNAPTDLWTSLLAGGYPRIPDQGIQPGVWLGDYARTYVERDVRQLLQVSNLRMFETFLSLVAGRTGQELNASSLSGDVGVSVNTIRAWLSVLEASYLIVLLPAWHPNHRKQSIKAPKLHFLDSGLACHLLGIQTVQQLAMHPLRGALFESWMVSEVMKARLHAGRPARMFHYREARGPEVDLLVQSEAGWILAEAKSGASVDMSFFQPMEALASRLSEDSPVERRLIYGGRDSYRRQQVAVTGWAQIQDRAWQGLNRW